VFIVILVGIGLAFITLIFEYWYYKNRDPVDPEPDPRLSNTRIKQASSLSANRNDIRSRAPQVKGGAR
jgi:hypothetical protein